MTYLKFISMAFQRSLAYRLEYFMALVNAFLYIFIFTSVWVALIPEGETRDGLSRSDMISYAILATLIKASFARSETLVSSRVRSGEIAVDLMKPFYFPLMFFSDTVGATLFQLFSRALPILIFSYFFFDIQIPLDPELSLKFLPVYLLAFLLFFSLSFFISSMAFYFVEIFPFWIMYYTLITLASGAIIPLDFFPALFKKLLLLSPFPYLFYFPTILLLGRGEGRFNYSELVLTYFILIIIMTCINYISYRFGVRKLTVVGG